MKISAESGGYVMKTYVFAGASNRALHMYAKPMKRDFVRECRILGVYDINPGRAQVFAELAGGMPVFTDFADMLEKTRPDCVIVTTVDAYHSAYTVQSLLAGCDVIVEKPMATDAAGCRAILDAEQATGKKVTVTFNYRFVPFVTRLKEIIAGGAVGQVYSVHFEWLLTRNMAYAAHGASYFRRWNARMQKSGGLLVHKATHHFDMVNWVIGQQPSLVSAFGQLNVYGRKNAPYHGTRCSTCAHQRECPFYYELTDFDKTFYTEQESYDGYIKDNCVFAPDIDIYDTMAVTVQYGQGAVMAYSLNATTPYEGWHLAINGSQGRLEMSNYETGPQAEEPDIQIRVLDLNNRLTEHHVSRLAGEHGGGDERLRRMLFLDPQPDPLGHGANSLAGAHSVLIGAAANLSIREKRMVSIDQLLGQGG